MVAVEGLSNILDVLVVEADADIGRELTQSFPRGTRFELVCSTAQAEERLRSHGAKVLICADDLEAESGLMFFARTKTLWPAMQRILLARPLDPELFFLAMKEVKLFHYLNKPVDPAEVARVVSLSLRDSPLARARELPAPEPPEPAAENLEKRGFAGGFLIGLLLSIAAGGLVVIPLTLYLLKCIAGIDLFPESHFKDWFR